MHVPAILLAHENRLPIAFGELEEEYGCFFAMKRNRKSHSGAVFPHQEVEHQPPTVHFVGLLR